ncbi:type II toxin-antitoxin system Phd/YefM family antitoxin [Caulobacter sp. 73W]|uniref:Antitoxin n=1 Tax=Caulobacter sp. 73W TaxID=3161137 RepID=A0AB39KZF3_9CAUL
MITTVSSREFNQDPSGVKKAATNGPVVITDRGRPAYVVLTFDQYRKLTAARLPLSAILGMADSEEITFEPQAADIRSRPADFDERLYSTPM